METVKAKTIRRKQNTEAEIQVQDVEQKRDVMKMIQVRRKDLVTVSDKVAGDTFYHVNYYPNGMKESTDEVDLRSVKKFYPYSSHGPLFIDEPQTERELALCEQKEVLMKKLGHKYLIIKRGQSELDCIEALV